LVTYGHFDNSVLYKKRISTVVTNLRHQQERYRGRFKACNQGIDEGISNDLLAMDIRQALHHLGEITGEITTDDLLENIFSKFCIGM